MQKLPMHTKNIADENFKKLAALFPQAVTEVVAGHDENGKAIIERAIDKDVLMAEIAAKVVDGPNIGENQRYQFTWPDKAKTVHASNQPIYKTLRPCREESVNFDDTENLYIEGDNLEVLKLLQESYLGKVKMIYIDPPYNTGNDFVYNDDFRVDSDEWSEMSGDYNEEGNRLFKNTDSNGRFHTDWLNMLYPRLKIARDLLSDDGVIFISIDDNEIDNLMKICSEIFGANNFVANMIWQKKYAVSNDDPGIAPMHDYVLVYRKSSQFTRNLLPRTDKQLQRYKNLDNDPRGNWSSDNYVSNKSRWERPTLWYSIQHPKTGEDVWPDENAVWRYSFEKHKELSADNRLYWGPDMSYEKPRIKRFLSEIQSGVVPSTWLPFSDVGHNDEAAKEFGTLIGKKIFSSPKPVRFLRYNLFLATIPNSNDIVLDFFSGSATTAHAVMQLNAEDGGNRKFIMVQLPEVTDEKSEAFKAGYTNICEIGKERIRRAGVKIKETVIYENEPLSTGEGFECGVHSIGGNDKPIPDLGFRVLKVDSTNMEHVYYTPKEYTQNMLVNLEENIKKDRTPEDLLFQVMLELAVPLSSRIEELTIDNSKVFSVDNGYLMASFDSKIQENTVEHIAKQKPYYFVMRDSSIGTDSLSTNFEQIFATYSPDTQLKVL